MGSLGPMHTLISCIYIVAFIVLIVQGLRNRPAPRWLAISGVLSLVLYVEVWWFYHGINSIRSWVVLVFVLIMFLHHVIQSGGKKHKWPENRKLGALTYKVVTLAVVLMTSALFVINHIILLTGGYTSENESILTGIWNHGLGWPAYALFFLAIALTIYRSKVARSE